MKGLAQAVGLAMLLSGTTGDMFKLANRHHISCSIDTCWKVLRNAPSTYSTAVKDHEKIILYFFDNVNWLHRVGFEGPNRRMLLSHVP